LWRFFRGAEQGNGCVYRIVAKCPELDGRNFLIMKMELPHPIETLGYEIIIRTNAEPLDKKTLKTLRDIALREKLTIEEKERSVMIFDALSIGHNH
jgi:hypothetical protein